MKYLNNDSKSRGPWSLFDLVNRNCNLSLKIWNLLKFILNLQKLIRNKIKQDSPPAWTQQPYRPPCSKSLAGGGGVPTSIGDTYLGQGRGTYLGQGGYLPWPRWGTYLGWRYLPWLGGVPTLTRGTYIGQVGVPTLGRVPPRCEQTEACENSTFPHPLDAGGNKPCFRRDTQRARVEV